MSSCALDQTTTEECLHARQGVSTREIVKTKMVLIILYPVGAIKSLNRAVTQSVIFQNSYSGWKVENKGLRRDWRRGSPGMATAIAVVRDDKGQGYASDPRLEKGRLVMGWTRLSKSTVQPLRFQTAPVATGSIFTLSWNQSHSNCHVLA